MDPLSFDRRNMFHEQIIQLAHHETIFWCSLWVMPCGGTQVPGEQGIQRCKEMGLMVSVKKERRALERLGACSHTET